MKKRLFMVVIFFAGMILIGYVLWRVLIPSVWSGDIAEICASNAQESGDYQLGVVLVGFKPEYGSDIPAQFIKAHSLVLKRSIHNPSVRGLVGVVSYARVKPLLSDDEKTQQNTAETVLQKMAKDSRVISGSVNITRVSPQQSQPWLHDDFVMNLGLVGGVDAESFAKDFDVIAGETHDGITSFFLKNSSRQYVHDVEGLAQLLNTQVIPSSLDVDNAFEVVFPKLKKRVDYESLFHKMGDLGFTVNEKRPINGGFTYQLEVPPGRESCWVSELRKFPQIRWVGENPNPQIEGDN